MPDITDLLTASAREPDGTPDLEVLERRADRLRRWQRLRRSSAVLLVAVVAVPLVRSATSTDVLEQAPAGPNPSGSALPSTAPPPAVASAVPTGVPSLQGVPSPGGSGAGSPAPVPGVSAPGRTRPTASASPTVATSRGPAESSPSLRPAAAPSCGVSTSGLAPGASRSCQFTATRSGGVQATWADQPGVFAGYDSQGYVDVTRRGATTRYDVRHGASSCAAGVIRPGDVVVVTVRQFSHGYEDFTVSAGAGAGC